MPNEFMDSPKANKIYPRNGNVFGVHGERQMDILMPELPRNKFVLVSDHSAAETGLVYTSIELSTRNVFYIERVDCILSLVVTLLARVRV